MAIAEQFAGLEMDKLIGAPLSAAADASMSLANSTAEFINRVGFDNSGNVRNVAFKYEKRSANVDGTSNLDEMKVDVPMLAIVPIPNLQIDEVNVLFDMEVKQSEKKDSSLDVGASLNASLGIGPFKVSVTGSVSVHENNTRSSDNSAKYHVDVRATNHGIPEGLARVLDMMAANVAPSLVNSSLKDGNGKDLDEASRKRAEQMKALREEISSIEKRVSSAQDSLNNCIIRLKKYGTSQQNAYQSMITEQTSKLDVKKDEEKKKLDQYQEMMAQINQSWSNFQNQAGDTIKMIADKKDQVDEKTVISLFALKALNTADNGNLTIGDYDDKSGYYADIMAAEKSAVDAQKTLAGIEDNLHQKKEEYNKLITSQAALPDSSTDSSPKPDPKG